jgi:hypothetical protein
MITYYDIIEAIRDKKDVELRHDVDISLVSAYNMAKMEANMGIKSIYYIRFDSDYYNILSHSSSKMIEYIYQNHEVGCHVDYAGINTEEDLKRYLERYNSILPFEKFTFHINTEKTMAFGEVDGFRNKSILKGNYISDSKNNFNQENLDRMKSLQEYTLTIHPEWWDNERWEFDTEGEKKVRETLRMEEICQKALKEILNYERKT